VEEEQEERKIIPLFGKDEMNLVEFPFGPVRRTSEKTLEVEHLVFDKRLKREVTRRLIITGSDKWGLPRPVDDQVLVGLKTLTHEAGYVSEKVEFSRYRLCRCIGWEPDGRAYARLEESLDRIKATTLKFKDSWYDNAAKEYKSKTFSIIEDVEVCSRDQFDRARLTKGGGPVQLCSVRWSDVIWKSFQDGFIRTLDMQMFRQVAKGRRREVPLRLYRILDKRFYHTAVAKFNLRRLCIGTLGLSAGYSPSQMARVLDRAAKWLVECKYLDEWWYSRKGHDIEVHFREWKKRAVKKQRMLQSVSAADEPRAQEMDSLRQWIGSQEEQHLQECEVEALAVEFGRELERKLILDERSRGIPVRQAGRIRQEYLRRFVGSKSVEASKRAAGSQ
jgi:hypothetical protein